MREAKWLTRIIAEEAKRRRLVGASEGGKDTMDPRVKTQPRIE